MTQELTDSLVSPEAFSSNHFTAFQYHLLLIFWPLFFFLSLMKPSLKHPGRFLLTQNTTPISNERRGQLSWQGRATPVHQKPGSGSPNGTFQCSSSLFQCSSHFKRFYKNGTKKVSNQGIDGVKVQWEKDGGVK